MPNFLKLFRHLMPRGRAFWVSAGSFLESMQKGLNISLNNAYTEGTTRILDSLLPDNDGFNADDATDWERRLAIAASSTTDLETRKSAIARKYAAPNGGNPAKQHYLNIERQLRAVGFDVRVHENIFREVETQTIDLPGFTNPTGIFADNGKLYVSTSTGIRVFDSTTGVHIPGEDFGQTVISPGGGEKLAIHKGKAYVCDLLQTRIRVFDVASGAHLSSEDIGVGVVDGPRGIRIVNGKIFVADTNNDVVRVFNVSDGSLLLTMASGILDLATDIDLFFDQDLGIYIAFVCDLTNGIVRAFNSETGAAIPGRDFGAGVTAAPLAIRFSKLKAYVTDNTDDVVHVFNATDGTHLASEDFGSGTLLFPSCLEIEDDKNFFVGDTSIDDVFVWRNVINTKTPLEILGSPALQQLQHGGGSQHGGVMGLSVDKVVNSLNPRLDAKFLVGDDLSATFFITGGDISDIANIDANREEEFRQLILNLKPTQLVAYIFVNYV